MPLGAEAAVHVARQWSHRNSGHVNEASLLTIDFENAFNSVDRAALLREVWLRLPGLAPYATWCYGHHRRLLFNGEPLTSEAGVQQGDPLGLGLYSLPSHFRRCELHGQGRWTSNRTWSSPSWMMCVWPAAYLTAAARQLGLRLNPSKCKLAATSHDGLVDPSNFPPPANRFAAAAAGERCLLQGGLFYPCHAGSF